MITSSHSCRLRLASILTLPALAVFFTAVAPVSAETYSGRAFAASVNALTGVTTLSDTGALSAEGGVEGAGELSASIPTVLTASVLNAATTGADGMGSSSASLADVVLFGGSPAQVTASFIMAESRSGFAGGATTQIYGLTFGGLTVEVSGAPNQVVSLLGIGTLTINEQNIAADGSSAAVNGLRLTLANGEEVRLASAGTAVSPGGANLFARSMRDTRQSPRSFFKRLPLRLSTAHYLPTTVGQECIDFVTGGGFFLPPHSTRPGRVNFGFNAGGRSAQNPEIKGHMNLNDHHDGTHVNGVDVDEYFIYNGEPQHCRVFGGNAKLNNIPGYRYRSFVCDYGEPGRDDRFAIDVTLGGAVVYNADNLDGSPAPFGGELDGGNIQLHKSKCPTTSSASTGPTI